VVFINHSVNYIVIIKHTHKDKSSKLELTLNIKQCQFDSQSHGKLQVSMHFFIFTPN